MLGAGEQVAAIGAAPYKLLSAVFAEPVLPEALAAALGELEPRPTDDPLRISLAVPRDQVADVAGKVLRLGRVVDLSVEEVPVEEIIREMFRAPSSLKTSVENSNRQEREGREEL